MVIIKCTQTSVKLWQCLFWFEPRFLSLASNRLPWLLRILFQVVKSFVDRKNDKNLMWGRFLSFFVEKGMIKIYSNTYILYSKLNWEFFFLIFTVVWIDYKLQFINSYSLTIQWPLLFNLQSNPWGSLSLSS